MGDIPAECGRQRSARGGPDALCPWPPPGAPFAQVSAAAHLGNPRQEELAPALHPCPLPPLPSRVGGIVGGRLHPSTRGSEHRRQPSGLQGRAPRCCWGVGGSAPRPGSPVPSTPERREGLRACYWEGPSELPERRTYICVSMLYWCFSFWLTSLCIIGSSFIHLIRTDSNVFFLMAE